MGVVKTKARNTFQTETLAKFLNRLADFNIAVSPPVIANMATVGASSTKCFTWFPQLKEKLFSSGPARAHAKKPMTAVAKAHRRITRTCLFTCSSLPFSYSSDKVLTELVAIPKLVAFDNKAMALLKSDIKPMPPGPRISATSLFRTRPMKMFKA